MYTLRDYRKVKNIKLEEMFAVLFWAVSSRRWCEEDMKKIKPAIRKKYFKLVDVEISISDSGANPDPATCRIIKTESDSINPKRGIK